MTKPLYFDKLMDALPSGCNNIPEVKILINLSFHKLLLVEFKLSLDDIANFSSMS
jgi:hypothetical protein